MCCLPEIDKNGHAVDDANGFPIRVCQEKPTDQPSDCDELDYVGMEVASGTDAMEAWQRLVSLPLGKEKDELRKSMLEYCELDTLAMVRIFEVMEEV